MCCFEQSWKIFNCTAEVNCTANFVTLCPDHLQDKGKYKMHFKYSQSNSITRRRRREVAQGNLNQLTQEQLHLKGSRDKWQIDSHFFHLLSGYPLNVKLPGDNPFPPLLEVEFEIPGAHIYFQSHATINCRLQSPTVIPVPKQSVPSLCSDLQWN